MRILSNVHTHTTWSDGRDSAREMVEAAIAKGFVSLGFSDHGWAPCDVCSMAREDEEKYRDEIRRLEEEYRGRIEIALGYEHDATTPEADLTPYDYVIESVHFLGSGENCLSVDESPEQQRRILEEIYGGDAISMCRDYFRSVARALMTPGIDIAGHIDLISKFHEADPTFDPEDPRYLAAALEVVDLAAERGLLVEINTGAMSRGWRTGPYPALPLLKRLKERNGRIIITSDCHNAAWLDFGFDRAVRLARAAGFTENWIWRAGRFSASALEE